MKEGREAAFAGFSLSALFGLTVAWNHLSGLGGWLLLLTLLSGLFLTAALSS